MQREKQRKSAQNNTTSTGAPMRLSAAQRRYLARGLSEAGGKLPIFDLYGREIHAGTIKSCVANGWAEPWISNPTKPHWLVCKLTPEGYRVLASNGPSPRPMPAAKKVR